jgi:hypothetical protein
LGYGKNQPFFEVSKWSVFDTHDLLKSNGGDDVARNRYGQAKGSHAT